MKNSAVLAAICKQFPKIKPENISVCSLSSWVSDGALEYEFAVMVLQEDKDEFKNYWFKCSLKEID